MTIPSQDYTGSETFSTTEWSLTTDIAGPDAQTTVGLYQCFIDFSALAVGDQYQVKCYEKIISGGTQRVIATWIINGPLADPIWTHEVPIPLMWGWDFTVDKLAGADAAGTWSIRNVAADAGSTLATPASILTTALTEAYAADGAAATLSELLYMTLQSLQEFAISGTTRTVKKLDGSTTAMVLTLDSATAPTSTTRSA